ncbi:TetR/AcrR family transcriptional regulator [Nocardioides immobilis]|uniref:TetR/AcrR family transcriptional regulator n=1 Tax=Nocardioides immobilis TaxID=2049295 RepID=A0A417Y7M2_9ACTN|nr:TetR/AcrR family transcriptional regulator [Nocardioides immobilis]RHW28511.1 TetR/AcrR family transcriptional regulator [Nocardioides immobilis]
MTEQLRRAPLKRTPRPRDRKQQIVNSAGHLFYRHGFHNVGTGQIAESVGITAGALYRHFKGKQDLLSHALTDAFTQATSVVLDASTDDLHEMVAGLAVTAGERRYLGVLWNREARFLDDEVRVEMRKRFFGFVAEFTRRLAATRPGISDADADLLSWCALGVLTSPSYHRTEMDSAAMVDLLERMTLAVCTTPLQLAPQGPEHAAAAPGLLPHGRREAILAAATRLFHKSGYQAVSMEDVGAAVGISGAGVYKYFPRKADLLSAVIARASEPLHLGLTRALGRSADASEGLANVLDAYVEFALLHHDLVGILVAEVSNLPEEHRRDVRRAQHDYVSEWIRLLRETRTDLDERQARFVVHAVLTVVNDVTRTRHLARRPGVEDDLRSICRRILAVDLT